MIVFYPYLVMVRFAVVWIRLTLAVEVGQRYESRPKTREERPKLMRLVLGLWSLVHTGNVRQPRTINPASEVQP